MVAVVTGGNRRAGALCMAGTMATKMKTKLPPQPRVKMMKRTSLRSCQTSSKDGLCWKSQHRPRGKKPDSK